MALGSRRTALAAGFCQGQLLVFLGAKVWPKRAIGTGSCEKRFGVTEELGSGARGSAFYGWRPLMKKLAVITISVLFAAPVLAQSVGEKSGVNSALGVSPSTADFVKQVASSDKQASSRLSGQVSRPEPLLRR
jgi:hypothetical protein